MQTLLPFLVILVLFWLLLILPQQRRQKQVREMQASLAVGDKVMLTAGVLGTVREITPDYVGVEVAEGSVLKVVRGAVGQVLPAESVLAEAIDGRTTSPVDAPASDTDADAVTLEKKDPEGNG